jgi:predicted RNA-binding Zn-ribbon protein involved in translation (DUF1610 family)
MNSCNHRHLELLPQPGKRLRCRHCHLTITPEELTDGYCPECFETQGIKRYDFEEVVSPEKKKVRYRCESCGLIIEVE